MFNATLIGELQVIERFESMPGAVREELKIEVESRTTNLQKHIINDKLHGQVLHQRSGALARSIQEISPIVDGESVYGRVFSAGDVKYAGVHEYGGTYTVAGRKLKLPSHMARRKDGTMAMTGTPYTVTDPERSYLRSSLADMSGDIRKGLKDAVLRGMKKASR